MNPTVLKRRRYMAKLRNNNQNEFRAVYGLERIINNYKGPLFRVIYTAGTGDEIDCYPLRNNKPDINSIMRIGGGIVPNFQWKIVKWYDQSGNGNDFYQNSNGSRVYLHYIYSGKDVYASLTGSQLMICDDDSSLQIVSRPLSCLAKIVPHHLCEGYVISRNLGSTAQTQYSMPLNLVVGYWAFWIGRVSGESGRIYESVITDSFISYYSSWFGSNSCRCYRDGNYVGEMNNHDSDPITNRLTTNLLGCRKNNESYSAYYSGKIKALIISAKNIDVVDQLKI